MSFAPGYDEANIADGSWHLYNAARWWHKSGRYLWWSTELQQWVITHRLGSGISERWRTVSDHLSADEETRCITDDHTGMVIHTQPAEDDYDAADFERYVGDHWWIRATDEEDEEEGENNYDADMDTGFAGKYIARGEHRGETENEYEGDPLHVRYLLPPEPEEEEEPEEPPAEPEPPPPVVVSRQTHYADIDGSVATYPRVTGRVWRVLGALNPETGAVVATAQTGWYLWACLRLVVDSEPEPEAPPVGWTTTWYRSSHLGPLVFIGDAVEEAPDPEADYVAEGEPTDEPVPGAKRERIYIAQAAIWL